ncbi:TadE/TadG family type IV pilus assembly protein [Methylobacterium nodulans]|uniref:Putative Flp pilus-assembly TadG-like N-terminal domain-containing protein n=1 Tax=Methylobacterium nodulans (strain LMG 21967 / CNCM I-2342 / ORS 2060) TaxID=460265 RepID=B8IQF3_METNO|nr:Tad domain-containing protein [Methylobacterium nodulans]ACL60465.1 hypothetical protein Mnod_5624 [Methylobacterium nodulans ORS 2060]
MSVVYRHFHSCDRGAVALIFAAAMIPLFGLAGAALDYANARRVRDVLQSISDATALLVADADTPTVAERSFKLAENQLISRLGDRSGSGGYTIKGEWLDGSSYKLTISTKINTILIHLLSGKSKQFEISAVTVANRIPPRYETKPPTLSLLSPEAADYNRIYMYCFSSDPKRQAETDGGRRGITPIADNATPPSNYGDYAPPTCGDNEAPSYMLRNVRDARTNPTKWDAKYQSVYEYYTDVVIDTGTRRQTMNMKGYKVYSSNYKEPINMDKNPILETIICGSTTSCKPQSEGGILPNNHVTHDPQTATTSCEEGKFMYYGWEDRPPNAGSDRDYDDIRLLVSCPKLVKVADKKIRIVQ